MKPISQWCVIYLKSNTVKYFEQPLSTTGKNF